MVPIDYKKSILISSICDKTLQAVKSLDEPLKKKIYIYIYI